MNIKNDAEVYAYTKEFPFYNDNRLMLNWYAKRIIGEKNLGCALELGLGHGITSLLFSKVFDSLVVLEGSQAVIDMFNIQNKNHKIKIVQTFFEEFDTQQLFDIIIMGFVLEHVDDPCFILEKFKKMLKPEGVLFVSVPNCEALNKRLGFEAGLLESIWELSESDIALGHKRLFSFDSLTKLVVDAGLVVQMVEGIFLKPITSKQINDLNLDEKVIQAMFKVGVAYPELSVGILMQLALKR